MKEGHYLFKDIVSFGICGSFVLSIQSHLDVSKTVSFGINNLS